LRFRHFQQFFCGGTGDFGGRDASLPFVRGTVQPAADRMQSEKKKKAKKRNALQKAEPRAQHAIDARVRYFDAYGKDGLAL